MKGFGQFREHLLFPDLCLINDGEAAKAAISAADCLHPCVTPAVVAIDQTVPPNDPEVSLLHQKMAEFARKENAGWYYGRGMAGHLLVEGGLTGPGRIVAGCSMELGTIGAVGALGVTLGPKQLADVLRTGMCRYEPPGRVRIHLKGELKHGVSAKDAALMIIKEFGANGLLEKTVCFTQDPSGKLTVRDRMILCGMMEKTGAVGAYFDPEEGGRCEDQPAGSFLLDAVSPLAAMPGGYTNIRNASEAVISNLRCVFIGGTYGGFLEDIRMTADKVRGRQVAARVRLVVAPATAEIYCRAADAGYITDILNAGGMVINQCGNPAVSARIGDGEGMISNDHINADGYAGGQGSGIVIASTETAVRFALDGGG